MTPPDEDDERDDLPPDEPLSDEEWARQMAALRAKAQAESDASRARWQARKRAKMN